MQIIHQTFPVIEAFHLGEHHVRLDALIDIIEGAVPDDGQLFRTGNLEQSSGGGSAGQHHAGTTFRSITASVFRPYVSGESGQALPTGAPPGPAPEHRRRSEKAPAEQSPERISS